MNPTTDIEWAKYFAERIKSLWRLIFVLGVLLAVAIFYIEGSVSVTAYNSYVTCLHNHVKGCKE